MNRWLVKTEPSDYSAADLEAEHQALWDGVRNPAALQHMRSMIAGDEVLVYHTGKEKRIVAKARVSSEPRPDPADDSGKAVVVDLEFDAWLKRPVELKEIKSDPAFENFDLVRQSRLSVMPVKTPVWRLLLKMGGGKQSAS